MEAIPSRRSEEAHFSLAEGRDMEMAGNSSREN